MAAASVVATEDLAQRRVQRGLPRRVERGEGLQDRPVVRAEDVDEVRGRPVAELEVAPLRAEVGRGGAEQVHEPGLRPPGQRRREARGRRDERGDLTEEVPEEALGGPAREADPPARAHDAKQFGGGARGIRGEHDAERRERDVERRLVERQGLGVGRHETDRQTVRLGTQAALREQRRDEVGGGDVGVASCGGERGVPVAGGDVEDALPGPEIDGLAQRLADDLQAHPDVAEVAGGPHGLLAGLEARGVVERQGRGLGHGRAPVRRRVALCDRPRAGEGSATGRVDVWPFVGNT